MSTLGTIKSSLRQRVSDGSNPYQNSPMMRGILCRLNIDPAAAARACDTALQILQLLSHNERQPQNNLPALDQS